MNKIGKDLKFHIYYTLALSLMFVLFSALTTSQIKTYRVFYKDKGPGNFSVNSDLYNQTLASLSPRAVRRRLKVRTQDNLITIEDSPVYLPYIQQIQKEGGKIRYSLNWRNYSVFFLDTNQLSKVKRLDFVTKVQETSKKLSTLSFKNNEAVETNFSTPSVPIT